MANKISIKELDSELIRFNSLFSELEDVEAKINNAITIISESGFKTLSHGPMEKLNKLKGVVTEEKESIATGVLALRTSVDTFENVDKQLAKLMGDKLDITQDYRPSDQEVYMDYETRLEELKNSNDFKEGADWGNQGNKHIGPKYKGIDVGSRSQCNAFAAAFQIELTGKLGKEVNPYSYNDIRVGDRLYYDTGQGPHWVVVTGVNGDVLNIAEANNGIIANRGVHYRTMNKEVFGQGAVEPDLNKNKVYKYKLLGIRRVE